jgi:hypothetical protein
MTARLGATIIELLEQAGERHLSTTSPDAYAALLLQVGGTNTLRRYDASTTYWEQVQAILDSFFSSAERAEICARLIGHTDLCGRPEFRGFHAHALAEQRLQELLAAAALATSDIGPAGAPARRPR